MNSVIFGSFAYIFNYALMSKTQLLFAFFLFSINLFSQVIPIDTTKKLKGCLYKVYYRADGKKEDEGCLINNKKEGIWVGYGITGKYYFLTNYSKGIKNGSFKMYYITGELREIGWYKNDFRADTSIVFKQNGDTIAKFCSEATKVKGHSTVKWRRYYDKNAKPDGTFEVKDGKNYMWQLGEMTEFKLKKN